MSILNQLNSQFSSKSIKRGTAAALGAICTAFAAPSAMATVEIVASRTTCTAPCGINFSVNNASELTSDRPFHNAKYIWNFGDDADAEFGFLSNDIPTPRDTISASGPIAAHVFQKPGTFTVTLDAEGPSGNTQQVTKTITVEAHWNKYAGDKTVCYSAYSNYSGCPTGAQQTNNLDSAVSILRSAGTGRLLLKSGETTCIKWEQNPVVPSGCDGTFNAIQLRNGSGYYISKYGGGAFPVLKPIGTDHSVISFRGADDIAISHLAIKGDYDPTVPSGSTYLWTGIFAYGGLEGDDQTETTNVTITTNSISGLGIAIYPVLYQDWVITNNIITDWHNFGIFSGDDSSNALPNRGLSILGNSIKQDENAINGPGGKDTGLFADHGPIRTSVARNQVISRNDLFSNTGWTGYNSSVNDTHHQPTIRYNTGGLPHSGLIAENNHSGGRNILQICPQKIGQQAFEGDIIVERNHLKATSNTTGFYSLCFGGLSLRQNVNLLPDVDPTETDFAALIDVKTNQSTTTANANAPVVIEDNFFLLSRGREGNDYKFYFTPNVFLTNISENNNIVSYPYGDVN